MEAYEIKESPREAYDKIVEYFSRDGAQLSNNGKENKRDYYSGYRCYYRHPEDGRRCAVGVLVEDDRIAKLMDRSGDVYAAKHRGYIAFADKSTLEYAIAWQRLHDASPTVTDFLLKLTHDETYIPKTV